MQKRTVPDTKAGAGGNPLSYQLEMKGRYDIMSGKRKRRRRIRIGGRDPGEEGT